MKCLAAALLTSTVLPLSAYGQVAADSGKANPLPNSGFSACYLSSAPGLCAYKPGTGLVSVPIAPIQIPASPLLGSASVPKSFVQFQHEHVSVRDGGATCGGTVDDSFAVSQLAATLRGTGYTIDVPGDCRLLLAGAAQIVLQGVSFEGHASRDTGLPYGQQGSTFLLTDTAKYPFMAGASWSMRGLNFFWPNQTEAAAAANNGQPIAYPGLIGSNTNANIVEADFKNNTVVNAYDVFDFSVAGAFGAFYFDNNVVFNLHYLFNNTNAGAESFWSNSTFSPIAYQSVALASQTTYLVTYAAANAEVFHIGGNGTATADPTGGSGAIELSNVYTFGYAYGLHVVGGLFDLGSFNNWALDGVTRPLYVGTGGKITNLKISHGTWFPYQYLSPTTVANAITVTSDSRPNQSLYISDVNMGVASGPCIDFEAPSSTLGLDNVNAPACGDAQNEAPPFNGVTFKSSGGRLTVLGGFLGSAIVNTGGYGVAVKDAAQASIVGTQFSSWGAPIDAEVPGVLTAGNRSVNTSGGNGPIVGTGAALALDGANLWDGVSSVTAGPIKTVSANYTMAATDDTVKVSVPSGGLTLGLPTCSGYMNKQVKTAIKIDSSSAPMVLSVGNSADSLVGANSNGTQIVYSTLGSGARAKCDTSTHSWTVLP